MYGHSYRELFSICRLVCVLGVSDRRRRLGSEQSNKGRKNHFPVQAVLILREGSCEVIWKRKLCVLLEEERFSVLRLLDKKTAR